MSSSPENFQTHHAGDIEPTVNPRVKLYFAKMQTHHPGVRRHTGTIDVAPKVWL